MRSHARPRRAAAAIIAGSSRRRAVDEDLREERLRDLALAAEAPRGQRRPGAAEAVRLARPALGPADRRQAVALRALLAVAHLLLAVGPPATTARARSASAAPPKAIGTHSTSLPRTSSIAVRGEVGVRRVEVVNRTVWSGTFQPCQGAGVQSDMSQLLVLGAIGLARRDVPRRRALPRRRPRRPQSSRRSSFPDAVRGSGSALTVEVLRDLERLETSRNVFH